MSHSESPSAQNERIARIVIRTTIIIMKRYKIRALMKNTISSARISYHFKTRAESYIIKRYYYYFYYYCYNIQSSTRRRGRPVRL